MVRTSWGTRSRYTGSVYVAQKSGGSSTWPSLSMIVAPAAVMGRYGIPLDREVKRTPSRSGRRVGRARRPARGPRAVDGHTRSDRRLGCSLLRELCRERRRGSTGPLRGRRAVQGPCGPIGRVGPRRAARVLGRRGATRLGRAVHPRTHRDRGRQGSCHRDDESAGGHSAAADVVVNCHFVFRGGDGRIVQYRAFFDAASITERLAEG